MADTPSILFINQHYYPEYVSAGQHLTDLAEYLAGHGFEVTVLCGRGGYTGESTASPRRERHNGVDIRRLHTTDFGRSSTIGRVTDYATFFAQSLLYTLFLPEYDYVITLTTPPLINVVGYVLRKIRGQKYGIWAMDIHPDIEVSLGMMKSGSITARVLHSLNDKAYRNADFVVALGDYMKKKIIEKGVSDGHLNKIPVWNKKEEVCPICREQNDLVEKVGVDGKFVVMYSGNAGLIHRFDEVMEVMSRLKRHSEIYFLFVGGGPRKKEICNYADRYNIRNFEYYSYFPRDQIKYSLSIADVHLLTFRHEMAGLAAPSKVYGIMGVGRPVLMVGPRASEPAQTIMDENIGRVIEPSLEKDGVDTEAADELEDAIMELYENEDQRRTLGKRGREAFLKKYRANVVCSKWLDLLNKLN